MLIFLITDFKDKEKSACVELVNQFIVDSR